MWNQIKILYNKVPLSFQTIGIVHLHRNLANALGSQVYYTPKLQKIPFTEQLAKYLRYLRRRDKITSQDLRSLVQAILTEYGVVHGLQSNPKFKDSLSYSITRNYAFKPNELSPYFGEADYMVWLTDTHFVPVLYFEREINPVAGMAAAHAAMGLKSLLRGDLRNSGYSIVTTGQEWQMFKVFSNLRSEKTVIYEGRNRFRNIVDDWEMLEVLLGLVDQCLETGREEVQTLRLAYDVIDQGKHMLEAKTPEEAQRASPVSKLLKKYFEKKRDETSK